MADEYARLIASMAIAHVANIAGCTSVQKSSLNALVDIMEKCTCLFLDCTSLKVDFSKIFGRLERMQRTQQN